MKKKNQKPNTRQAKRSRVEKRVSHENGGIFITPIDDRKIKIDYQLVLGQALCIIRTYQDFANTFLEGLSPKERKEQFAEFIDHNKVTRRFLKRYYWKQA